MWLSCFYESLQVVVAALIRDCVSGGWGGLLIIFGQFLVNVTRQTLILPFSISLLPIAVIALL